MSPTYWSTRRPNRGNLAELLIANTVTGAAAMLRRDALDWILPFPPKCGAAFHDHWIACAALAAGDIIYLDEPLYDYVQHAGSVIGHFSPPAFPLWTRACHWLKFFWPSKLSRNLKVALGNGRTHFFDNWLRVQQIAVALATRFGDRLSPERRRALDRALDPAWLTATGCRRVRGISTTVGMEFHMLHARLWMEYMRIKKAVCAGWTPRGAEARVKRRAA